MNSVQVSNNGGNEPQSNLSSRAPVVPLGGPPLRAAFIDAPPLAKVAGGHPWRRAWARLATTTADPAAAMARVALGVALFPHGAQHALGWFGGYGFSGTLGWMTGTLGFPAWAAALAILTELVAPLALIVGAASRLAALGIIGIMLGAITTHLPNGFFMNWFGSLPAGQEGFEYHLLVIALSAVVVIAGGGILSMDCWLARLADSDRVP